MTTPYHARYFAHELTRQHAPGSDDRLSMALFDACVNLTPHQIDAAAFALRNPLSKGVLLADEVGLGKTIEAGLVLCQNWAEHKRRLIVICPASLRKQWSMELEDKFHLPTVILDARTYRQAQNEGNPNPFLTDRVVITSLNFASTMRAEVRAIPFDLVVIDEAHKLRNAYRPSNKMGQNIKWAVEERRKLLLTATPFQNSLLELFGFLDKDLLPQVQEAFKQYKSADKSVLQGELDKLEANITSAGMNPDESPKVKELRKRLNESAVDVTALENEIFSHLFNFFRRYYSEGDFISLRRYKEGVYAIPYEGEEVKLHWANADQYYIKSSETFRHVPQTIKFIVGKNDVFYTQKFPEMWLWFVFDDTPEAQADKKHLAEWLASKANPDEPFSGDWMITNPPFSDN